MTDPVAKRLADDQCERALQDLGSGAVLVANIRRALAGPEGFRSLHQVAVKLGVTPRSLMKILIQQGTPFTSLVDEEREKRARRLLQTTGLTMEDVATQLGYSSVSNFVRAFHRWTGQTPAAYRRSALGLTTRLSHNRQ
jgi:AraC-like DNA-binding protein